MAITRDLEIRGRADFRQVEQAAKRAEAAQDKFTQKARAANQKAIQQGGVLTQKIKEQERARDRLAKLVERTERKEALFGRNREQRLRVEGRLLQQQARQAGATAAQIEKIGRAYDRMADKAARAARAAGGGRFGGAATVGRAAVGVAAAAGVGLGVGEATQFAAESARAQANVERLALTLDVLARRTGESREEMRLTEAELRRMRLTQEQSLDAIQRFTRAGATQEETITLVGVALDAAARRGLTLNDAITRLTDATAKAEPELLDELGIVVKLGEVYQNYADKLGVTNANQLTARDRSRALVEELIRQKDAGGEYAETVGTLSRRLLEVDQAQRRAKENLGQLFKGEVRDSAQAYLDILNGINRALESRISANRDFQIRTDLLRGRAPAVGPAVGAGAAGRAEDLLRLNTSVQGDFGASQFGLTSRQRQTLEAQVLEQVARTRFQSEVVPTIIGRLQQGVGAAGLALAEQFEREVEQASTNPPPPPRIPQRFRILESFQPARSGPRATTVSGGAAPGAGGVGPGVFGFRNYFSSGTSAGAAAGVLAATNDEAFAALQAGNNRRIEEEQRVQERIRRENERTFEDLKRQSADVFDALLLRGESVWNVFRNAGLTALRDIVSSQSAGALFALFGGRTPAGALGLPGGGAGFGLGGFGPGGTAGFAGPVAGFAPAARVAAGSSRAGAGAAGAGFGSAAFGALGFGLGGGLLGAKVPGSGAVKGAAAAGLGFAGAFVGATAASGVGLGASVGLLGVALSNPFSAAAVGGIVGVGALIGALSGGARSKARKKIQDAYGVRIEDKGVLQQVVEIGKGLGGSLDAAVSSPAVRELVLTWAMATGQDRGSGLFPTVTETRLISRGGRLFQGPTYHNGRAATFASGLPVADVDPRATLTTISPASQAARSPELTADAASRAFEASALRRETAALLLQPNVAVGA